MQVIPRFMITATSSGSGKTLCTCGLLRAFSRRLEKLVSFKCGPDFIDPMFHEKVLGTKSRNLDPFFTGEETTRFLLSKNGAGADLCIVEGVMGYYDGLAGISSKASAWDLARITETPAVLLVNCKGLSVSALAIIKGFLDLKEESQIKGVILNRVSPMMFPRMKQMIEEELGVKVYGYLPQMKGISLESRHLGLVLPGEIEDLQRQLDLLADQMEKSLDLDGLLELAKSAGELAGLTENFQQVDESREENKERPEEKPKDKPGSGIRIALARDDAFCFFYEDNLDFLRSQGVELVEFSPLKDKKIPENVQGLILNGGYPELHAKELSQNFEMRESIKSAIESGLPTTAECGGFLYLHEQMADLDGNMYPMAGFIAGEAKNTGKLSRFGYITLSGRKSVATEEKDLSVGKVFGKEIGDMPAHEFHYYDSTNCGSDFHAKKPLSKRAWDCIHAEENVFLGFPHMYYYGNLEFPMAFLEACRKFADH